MRINSKRILQFAIILVCMFGASCSKSTMKTTAAWVNKEKLQPEPYKSVFIMVITDNMEAKILMEDDLAAAATARGLKPYTFLNVFGPIATVEYLPKHDVVQKRVAELPSETIFTVALVDVKSETHYVPESTTIYSPYSMYPYYGSFGGYYSFNQSMYQPGYYQTDSKYFLEGNLYNVQTGDLLMSIQTKADNPESIKKSSKKYTQLLIDEVNRLRKETAKEAESKK